jgi:uncharacterized protein YraI
MRLCFRILASAVVCVGLFLGDALALTAQAAVVKRNVNLRVGPSTSTAIIELLLPGDELTILNPVEQANYFNVRAADGEEGWVWSPNIRVFAADSPAPAVVAGPPEVYRTCPLEGDAVQAFRQAANRLKNRNTAPTPAQIDAAVTLAAMVAPGDDANRWQPTQGASIVGFVIDVKARRQGDGQLRRGYRALPGHAHRAAVAGESDRKEAPSRCRGHSKVAGVHHGPRD